MLTLKVITTEQDGQSQTHLFNGDVITHKEYFSFDHYLTSKKMDNNASIWVVGNMMETTNNQKFTASDVCIYDEDRVLKNLLFILPKADCYIMDNGKTIDSFFCQYEQMTAGEIGDNLVDKQ